MSRSQVRTPSSAFITQKEIIMKNFIILFVILLITTLGIYFIDNFFSAKISNLSDIQKFIDDLKL